MDTAEQLKILNTGAVLFEAHMMIHLCFCSNLRIICHLFSLFKIFDTFTVGE